MKSRERKKHYNNVYNNFIDNIKTNPLLHCDNHTINKAETSLVEAFNNKIKIDDSKIQQKNNTILKKL
ncbi:MAG: hypothetical protein LBS34_01515 [Rickettsiales bacterium]|jgi:hypothetical protein|nr:hypothetical protein [Rickettsiales bacterium]